MPAWEPVGLLSSALLFMTWQREGVSLETCWSSQQCSAVHEMATRGCQLKDMLVFSAIPAQLHIKLFGRIGMLVLRAAERKCGLCQRPLHPSRLLGSPNQVRHVVNTWCTRGVHVVNTW